LGCTVAASLLGVPLVFDAHEYFSEVPEVVRRPTIQRVWRGIENLCIPHSAVAFTVSQSLADLFKTLYNKPFGLVSNVPQKREALQRRPAPGRIVYTGAVNEGRGLEELIGALPQLPGYTVVVCGQGPLQSFLEELVLKLGVEDRVHFTGQLSPEALQAQVAQAWLGYGLLVPNGLSYQYSLANKFFDYMQAGVPQLCPNLPEYQAILAQFPVGLAVACTQEEIVKAVLQMADAEFYASCQAASKEASTIFTWEEEKKSLLALYAPLKG
jgi:glycosyltransferase involved in cell wall biosynthesis